MIFASSPFAGVCRVRASAESPRSKGDLSLSASQSERDVHFVCPFLLYGSKQIFQRTFRKALYENPLELEFYTEYNIASVCHDQANEMKGISKSDSCSGQKLVAEK